MKHYSKTEKEIMKCKQGPNPFEAKEGEKLQLWQKLHNRKLKKEAKWSQSGDQAEYERIKQKHKRRILFIPIAILVLAIIGLSITGIALAAIDFSHHIYNAKSICFMVFGGLVWLLILLDLIFVPLIRTVFSRKKRSYDNIWDKREMARGLINRAIQENKPVNDDLIKQLAKESDIEESIIREVHAEMISELKKKKLI